ncbi:MAG TPA: DUF2550 domain-containing protein [Nocardioidaceae bacterium]|nr:DUF2550 domain-containing protein [Nocardioidaceae bacterium]
MPAWQWAADAAGAVLVLVLLYGLCLVVRRRWISRHGGTFEFSVRVRPHTAGRGWVLGVGRYSGDELEWFRIFSVLPRPKLAFRRHELAYEGRREPVGPETYSLYAGHVIVRCRTPLGPIEVAMSPEALTGFLAWLEAAPPGQGLRAR